MAVTLQFSCDCSSLFGRSALYLGRYVVLAGVSKSQNVVRKKPMTSNWEEGSGHEGEF